MHDEFLTWCDARIATCKAEQATLTAESRGDEATHMQIRSNVYGIFRTTWTAVKGDRAQMLFRLESIPAAWAKHLALAEAHGDANAAHIERIKLATADEIRNYAMTLEENHD